MSQTPAPPSPALDPKYDAETLKLLDALDTGPVRDLEANKKALREHLGTRIVGDLRPRVLAGEVAMRDATSYRENASALAVKAQQALERAVAAEDALTTAQADFKAIQGREKAAVEAQTRLKKAMTDKGIKLP